VDRASLIEGESGQAIRWKGGLVQVAVHSRVNNSLLRAKELGPLLLIQMRCGSVTISRPQSGLPLGNTHMSTFMLLLSGRATLAHYGHVIELMPGDMTLYDHSAVYSLHFDRPTQVIMIRVSTRMIRELFATPDYLYGQRIAGDVGLTSTALAMAVDLVRKMEGDLSLHFQERAARHLLDVLATSYAEALDQLSSGSSLMAGRFWKVRLFIEENLRDPTLSPSTVAERLKLSDRYLRMIFAISDESPSAYILRRRLEECARQLADEQWRGRSITDIAFSWGFNSAPHFTRTFRQRFSVSPSEYRRKQQASQSAATGKTGKKRELTCA